jgi:hypothetical protein
MSIFGAVESVEGEAVTIEIVRGAIVASVAEYSATVADRIELLTNSVACTAFNPEAAASVNLTIPVAATYSCAFYTRFGNMVIGQFYMTGMSITASATRTQIQWKLPIPTANNTDHIFGDVTVRDMDSGEPYTLSAGVIVDATSTNNTHAQVTWQAAFTGAFVMYVHFQYVIQ